MPCVNAVCLRLSSNASAYEVLIYDSYECRRIVANGKKCVFVRTASPYLSVVAKPRGNRYLGRRYFKVNASTCDCVELFFSFQLRVGLGVYAFYLVDKNYGLPISGTLTFNFGR